MLAHEHAHICTDETGAPGFFGRGVGLIGLSGASGRIRAFRSRGGPGPARGPRADQPAAALSLTTAAEYGTVYSQAHLESLVAPAKAEGCGVHLDGARLANAVAAGFDLKSVAKMGVDILVMGGDQGRLDPEPRPWCSSIPPTPAGWTRASSTPASWSRKAASWPPHGWACWARTARDRVHLGDALGGGGRPPTPWRKSWPA
ncbi:beta-eliminating lyase-related protein [Caulobacter segnis]